MPTPPSDELLYEDLSRQVDRLTVLVDPPPPAPGARQTQVINVRSGRRFDVYIGRANPSFHLTGSKWANPFPIGREWSRQRRTDPARKVVMSGDDRRTVLEKYRAYLLSSPMLLSSLGELYGLTLACWCAPLPCHGHLLAALADRVGLSGIPADPAATEKVRGGVCLWDGGQLADNTGEPRAVRCVKCQTTYRPDLAVFGGRSASAA